MGGVNHGGLTHFEQCRSNSPHKTFLLNKNMLWVHTVHSCHEQNSKLVASDKKTIQTSRLALNLPWYFWALTDCMFSCAKHIVLVNVNCPQVNILSYWDGWCSTKDPCFLSESLTATPGWPLVKNFICCRSLWYQFFPCAALYQHRRAVLFEEVLKRDFQPNFFRNRRFLNLGIAKRGWHRGWCLGHHLGHVWGSLEDICTADSAVLHASLMPFICARSGLENHLRQKIY